MTEKKPLLLLALLPVITLIGLLFLCVRMFGSDTIGGASQIALLIGTAVCVALSLLFCGVKWKAIETAIVNNLTTVALAILILLMIGALSGAWMVSGVIPALIYYGMKIIHPDLYLATTCIICAVVSVLTGSSWTTVATVGIALAGIGIVQGFSPGWVGGAIISGAYFGDKISPLSDTTVLASAVTETPLFTHIRYMMITTVPSIVVTLVIFTIAGFSYPAVPSPDIASFSASLHKTFNLTPWLLLVPAAMAVLIGLRLPSLVTLFVSCLIAAIFALLFQPHLLQEIAGEAGMSALGQLKGCLKAVYGSTQIDTGVEQLNNLVGTRGMAGMLNTVWLILCAMCFGGAMTASGMLARIIEVFLVFMKRTVGMVAATIVSGLCFNILAGDQYLAVILTGNMYKDIFRDKGYESRLLSRTTEDGVTVTSPLVPWNTCGMTQATVLGIPTLTYLPYSFFNLISPLMSIIIATTGYKIYRKFK